MRGGITIQDLMHVYSHDDREIMYGIIESNIELSKMTGQNFM